jgi:hypothetical protein
VVQEPCLVQTCAVSCVLLTSSPYRLTTPSCLPLACLDPSPTHPLQVRRLRDPQQDRHAACGRGGSRGDECHRGLPQPVGHRHPLHAGPGAGRGGSCGRMGWAGLPQMGMYGPRGRRARMDVMRGLTLAFTTWRDPRTPADPHYACVRARRAHRGGQAEHRGPSPGRSGGGQGAAGAAGLCLWACPESCVSRGGWSGRAE